MTAQISEVTRAYAFVMRYRGEKSHTVGAIANSVEEARTQLRLRYNHLDSDEFEFFNNAVCVMEPAHIIQWDDNRNVAGLGSFAFLEGMFFGEYDGNRTVVRCGKMKLRDSLVAVVYGGDYEVKPLSQKS